MDGPPPLGSKRPQSADMQPRDSTELRSFLENIGLSIDEFQDMRREEQVESTASSQGIGKFCCRSNQYRYSVLKIKI